MKDTVKKNHHVTKQLTVGADHHHHHIRRGHGKKKKKSNRSEPRPLTNFKTAHLTFPSSEDFHAFAADIIN